jgi:hypothetical protein
MKGFRRNAARALVLQGIFLSGLALAGQAAWAQQYDSGDPTADEQFVLEVINRARANPFAEGARLQPLGLPNGDITEGLVAPDNHVGVRPPLAMNKALLGTARAHNQDMYTTSLFQHNSSTGVSPGDRMTAAGFIWQKEGENIAASSGPANTVNATAAQLEDLLMIDAGEPGRGHRVNLLDTFGPPNDTPFYREVGVGYLHENTPSPPATGPTAFPGMTDLLTQDFGTSQTAPGPFLLGVIFTDGNGNNLYDAGEGVGGITVNIKNGGVVQSAFAVTASAGGYAVPIPGLGGTLTVMISGGTLAAPVSADIALGGENVKLDFIMIMNGTTAKVAPSATPPPPPPGSVPGGGSTTQSHSSGCGLLGVEALAAWMVLRWRRRRASLRSPRALAAL